MSDELIVIANLTAAPGEGAALQAGLEQHAKNCLANEPDCLQFDISRDRANPDRLTAYEMYRNEAGFEAHKASKHFAWFGETYGHLIAEREVRTLTPVARQPKHRMSSSSAKKILVTAKPLHRYLALLKPLSDAGYAIELHDGPPLRTNAEVVKALDGVVATIASIEPYNTEVLSAVPDFRLIARLGVGYDQIDVPAATRAGVAVAMTFGTNHEPVADHAFALLAGLTNQLSSYDQRVRSHGWGTQYHGALGGLTVGIIGFGRIGRAFAKRCQGFNMRLLVADPFMDAATVSRLGAELLDLPEVLAQSDVVSLHCPLDPSTHHMINAERLALMPNHAVIINTARGPIIDEAALIDALQSHAIAGAGLDVFEVEPLAQSPLKSLNNVILTPHVAGLSEPAILSMGKRCVSNVLDVLQGRDPGGDLVLNPEVLSMTSPVTVSKVTG